MEMRKYVTLRITLLCVLLTAAMTAVIGMKSISDKKRDIGETLAETAYLTSDKLDRYMWSRYSEIKTFSRIEAVAETENYTSIRKTIENLQKNIPSFSWIGFTDTAGTVKASTGGILEGIDISKRPVFTEGIKGEFVGDVHDAVLLAKLLPNPSGEPMKFVDVSFAVEDASGSRKGVLAAHLSWEWVNDIKNKILEPVNKRKNISVYIISQDNTVLLGPKEEIGMTIALDSLKYARNNDSGWRVEDWGDGSKYLTGYSFSNGYGDYKGLGWTVLIRQPLNVAYQPVQQLQVFIISTGVLFTLIFSAAGWVFAGAVSSPIVSVAKAADKLRFGKIAPIPVYKGIKEIEVLSDSINDLILSLSSTESELNNMRSIALADKLTGLPNRAALERYLEKNTALAARQGFALEFMYIDLDGFKPINDTYGHAAGDEVLKEVGRRLTASVRKEEIAARIGGDEFAAVLFASDLTTGENVAARIIESVSMPVDIDGKSVRVGCSIGISLWESGNCTAEVFEKADKALYISKKNGKNRYTRN
ncbi:sensor domain-containing diguanylate cyclase [Geovibrio ferrireducens]|uniref:sensor domain-containing diguanylate cyclase n=1 Tax=Geovibrio ferrireducens TaxID=46201 RepID=UPI0022469520|nr:diguanylate cyclase [Geovibrio ferrireducens]